MGSSAADKIISVVKCQTVTAAWSADSRCVFGSGHTRCSQKSHRSFKIVVKFESEALRGGCCVSLSYRSRCLHTEEPGCLMGCSKGHCRSVIRGGSPEIHQAGPAGTVQEPQRSAQVQVTLHWVTSGFSFDLTTKVTGWFFLLQQFKKSNNRNLNVQLSNLS